LLELLNSALSQRAVEARGLLHYGPVKQLIDDHRANRLDGTDRLLALLNLEVWCRVYLDKRSSEDVADELKEAVA
jgi:asparagine synthase (glutamine-hydrolysing)